MYSYFNFQSNYFSIEDLECKLDLLKNQYKQVSQEVAKMHVTNCNVSKDEMLKYVDKVMKDLEKERSFEIGMDTKDEIGVLLGLCIKLKCQLKYKVLSKLRNRKDKVKNNDIIC